MIVVAILGILMGIGMFPYGEYMKREALSASVDTVAQEWIIAHKIIRNGIVFTGANTDWQEQHARILIEFQKGAESIKEYLVASGADLTNISSWLSSDPQYGKLYKEYSLEKGVKILSWTIFPNPSDTTAYFYIEPPYGSGSFVGGSQTGTITIGYPNWSNLNGGAKDIFLRPYLQ